MDMTEADRAGTTKGAAMPVEIKSRFTNEVLFSGEYASLKDAVVAAVKAGANLRGAYLRGADLRGANLGGADLGGADLDDTKIKGTNAIIQIGPIGSRADMMLVFNTDDGLRVSTGCFYGSADDFLVRVMETHGTNQHATNYRNALELAASMLK